MGRNKLAVVRYKTLDACFSNPYKHYFFSDLMDEVNKALIEEGYQSGVSERQLYDDIKFMQSENGWEIELLDSPRIGRKKYYRYKDVSYSISDSPLGARRENVLKEAISIMNEISGLPGFHWLNEAMIRLRSMNDDGQESIISFSYNPYLKGLAFFSVLYDAIKNKKALRITYRPYTHDNPSRFLVHPYYLKQYNDRWFLFGFNSSVGEISNMALDRIEKVKHSDNVYLQNTFIDFNEYFDDNVGVTVKENDPIARVVLKVKNIKLPYFISKPIHGSQRIIERGEDYSKIELSVRINYELEALLLSHGDALIVETPAELREKIRGILQQILATYQ
ncbi:MAG: WYL domain-containing protein [Flavobacteriales bacterium]|nr:MAG: WYL domain-containing protein [Flavobacteriales bacterium]